MYLNQLSEAKLKRFLSFLNHGTLAAAFRGLHDLNELTAAVAYTPENHAFYRISLLL